MTSPRRGRHHATEDVNERNSKEKFKEECKILDTYVNNRNKKQTVVIEMPAEIYKYVKETEGGTFLGYQRCKSPAIIVQDTGIVPCVQNARSHTRQAYAAKQRTVHVQIVNIVMVNRKQVVTSITKQRIVSCAKS